MSFASLTTFSTRRAIPRSGEITGKTLVRDVAGKSLPRFDSRAVMANDYRSIPDHVADVATMTSSFE